MESWTVVAEGLDHERVIVRRGERSGLPVIVGGTSGRGVRIWDARSGKLEKELLQGEGVTRPYFSPDGRWLMIVTGTEFGIWEPGTWRLVRQFALEQGGDNLLGAAFTPDGSILAVVESRTTVRLFETRTWQPLAHRPLASSEVQTSEPSPVICRR